MQLQLKYHDNTRHATYGAFVQGQKPLDWLREMDSWKVALQNVTCYLIPESIGVNKCAGLFVIFNPSQLPQPNTVRNPYTRMADKLYMPVNAVLYPVIEAGELKTLLLWDIQFFHPVIGLVGFEKKDEIMLDSFIHLPAPVVSNWSFAHPGIALPAAFQQIALEAEDERTDIIEQMKEDVGSKPLQEIPLVNADDSAFVRRSKAALNIFARIGLYFLLLFALTGKLLFGFLGAIFPVDRSNQSSSGGLLQKMEGWINQKLQDIEKQRDTELKRLLKLFDKDTDEALQYAIPLASPYLNRGTAPQSGKLTRRSLQFNLRNLGGGGRVDGWDLGAYNYELQKRYEKAANDAVNNGNFKRAAYIYAHLLGNFFSAANVLQQGKFYREAAELYKDHLKNERMAAECLEKGGLLTDAIPLYIGMGHLEKVGDLYCQLGQEDKAEPYYMKVVREFKVAKDYQKAASVTLEKLNNKDEALSLLLTGWKDNNHPEACLTNYLELHYDPENRSLVQEVSKLFNTHVTRLKRTSFLNVLADINRRYPDEQLEEISRNIAYEIIHQQVDGGDTSALKLISGFVPGDRLLSADANRFIQNRIKLPPINSTATYLKLRKDTQWFSLVTYHDQLLGIGIKNADFHFVRANWEGKVSYEYLFKGEPPLWLLAEPSFSDMVLLIGSNMPLTIGRKLDAYSFFDRELFLRSIDWLPDVILRCCLNADNGITALHFDIHGMMLSHFSLSGDLIVTHHLQLNDERINPGQEHFDPSGMVWRKEHFYIAMGAVMLRISKQGEVELVEAGGYILKFTISSPNTALKIALLTDNGCLMITPLHKEMKISSAIFAQDIDGRDIKLMTDNRLVVSGEKRAAVYELTGDTPSLKALIETENRIVQIVAIPKRHHCAFLESDNRISVYQMIDN
jgi:tetratricopeptide (TPR) repeat protein